MKKTTQRFIRNLKLRKGIQVSTIYQAKQPCWNFYYSITGWYFGKYFSVYIYSHPHNDKTEVEITENTECKEKMKAILTKYNF